MKTGLRPLTLAVLSLGTFACSDLLPEVTSDSQTEGDSSGTNTGGPTTTTGNTPDTTTGVDSDTTGEQTTNVDTTMGSATETTDGGTDTTTGETDGETDETTTGGSGCIQLTVEEALSQGGSLNFWQTRNLSPMLGGVEPDQFRMEFYTPDTGPFDLGAFPNDNYADCEQCLRIFEDLDGMGSQATQFFQESGMLTIDAASDPEQGPVIASTSGVTLIEVEIDMMTLESTPVMDGRCIELQDYNTAPNNSCAGAGACGDASPVPGSFPECTCDETCFATDSCCPDICNAGVCDGEAFCAGDTEIVNDGPGLGLAITDNGYNGTLGSMTCVPLMVAADGIDTIADVSVEIGMSHTFIGDLTIKVVSPSGANPITVLSRPGLAEAADNGMGPGGDSSNLVATDSITFDDGAPNDAEAMGDTINDNGEVCMDDGECSFFPNAGAAIAGDFSSLAGQDSVGLWEICIGDSVSNDVGGIDFVELTIDQVP